MHVVEERRQEWNGRETDSTAAIRGLEERLVGLKTDHTHLIVKELQQKPHNRNSLSFLSVPYSTSLIVVCMMEMKERV